MRVTSRGTRARTYHCRQYDQAEQHDQQVVGEMYVFEQFAVTTVAVGRVPDEIVRVVVGQRKVHFVRPWNTEKLHRLTTVNNCCCCVCYNIVSANGDAISRAHQSELRPTTVSDQSSKQVVGDLFSALGQRSQIETGQRMTRGGRIALGLKKGNGRSALVRKRSKNLEDDSSLWTFTCRCIKIVIFVIFAVLLDITELTFTTRVFNKKKTPFVMLIFTLLYYTINVNRKKFSGLSVRKKSKRKG